MKGDFLMAQSSVLTHAIIQNSTQAVESYVSNANSLQQRLDGVISNLTGSNFNGDASDGFKAFYTEKVVPALTDNLTAASGSLMASIKSILEAIQQTLLDSVDPELGENNRNPGA
jgi:predicted ribonuclease toxin of YeeF-YezG toxin-antitoxin module